MQKFDLTGKFLGQFGGAGATAGKFNSPAGIAIDRATGNIYVADSGNSRIQKFNSSGTYLS
ncbi:6-bladed beta-propeller, partial [Pseudomonas aeruginosa]